MPSAAAIKWVKYAPRRPRDATWGYAFAMSVVGLLMPVARPNIPLIRISLILYGVRAQKDDLVDRPEVEVQ